MTSSLKSLVKFGDNSNKRRYLALYKTVQFLISLGQDQSTSILISSEDITSSLNELDGAY